VAPGILPPRAHHGHGVSPKCNTCDSESPLNDNHTESSCDKNSQSKKEFEFQSKKDTNEVTAKGTNSMEDVKNAHEECPNSMEDKDIPKDDSRYNFQFA